VCFQVALGISGCRGALGEEDSRWGPAQDVVSREAGESCGSSAAPAEEQLVAGEPTEERLYLKKLQNRYCRPSVALGQQFS